MFLFCPTVNIASYADDNIYVQKYKNSWVMYYMILKKNLVFCLNDKQDNYWRITRFYVQMKKNKWNRSNKNLMTNKCFKLI